MTWKSKKNRVIFTPTLYESSLWLVVNSPRTQIEEAMRTRLRASLTLSGSEAALQALLVPYEEQLDAVADEAYAQHLHDLIATIMQEAEAILWGLTEEEHREVAMFEASYWHEALRRDLLTEEEIDRALCHFEVWAYQGARTEVERLLLSRNPLLRSRALTVLVALWGIDANLQMAVRFLSDEDPRPRKQAIHALTLRGAGGNECRDT